MKHEPLETKISGFQYAVLAFAVLLLFLLSVAGIIYELPSLSHWAAAGFPL